MHMTHEAKPADLNCTDEAEITDLQHTTRLTDLTWAASKPCVQRRVNNTDGNNQHQMRPLEHLTRRGEGGRV